MSKAYLVLANGKVFEGESFGADGEKVGELVFSTSCVGYLEAMNDPNYFGQILIHTFPMAGDYGIIEEDIKGKPFLNGFVVREYCKTPSNFRCDYEIEKYMKDNGIVGICGIDTRELTRIIRDEGALNAAICKEVPSDLGFIKVFKIEKAVESVTDGSTEIFEAADSKFNITFINFGTSANMIDELVARGCTVKSVPYTTSPDDILAEKPDGIVISDGPGCPCEMSSVIDGLKKFSDIPVYAFGLGHELLAIANGAKYEKLKYGHRGSNQPVRYSETGRSYITSQNHSYSVVNSTVNNAEIVFTNINDGAVEGLKYKKALSVSFYPSTCVGPQNTGFVFDSFISLMGGKN